MTEFSPATLRQTLRKIRAGLSARVQAECSEAVIGHIQTLDAWHGAKNIALYLATQGEIRLDGLWQSAAHQGKCCAFPVLAEGKTLLFLPATPDSPFKSNRFGIAEPDVSADQAIAPHEFDIMCLPLVAFDEAGNRLGMGAGYYDRSLAEARGKLLIGVGYDFQKVPQLLPQAWDIPLDYIVTPSGIIQAST